MTVSTKPRTLGYCATEIAVRCGFGAMGDAEIADRELWFSFVRMAQEALAVSVGVSLLNKVTEINITPDQKYYDLPIDCDPYAVLSVYSRDGNAINPMARGVPMQELDDQQQSIPCYYELEIGPSNHTQLRVAPVPGSYSRLLLKYERIVNDLQEADDIISLPYIIVFYASLTQAKAHFGMEDAALYDNLLGQLTSGVRGRSGDGHIVKVSSRSGRDTPHGMRTNIQQVRQSLSYAELIADTGEQLVTDTGITIGL